MKYQNHRIAKTDSRYRAPARERGFTLVEMIVAVGLFAVVMMVCVGALLSLVHANRKAQALQSVMNNLNIALDGMVRAIRMGTNYDGSSACSGAVDPNAPHDCPSGGEEVTFEPFNTPTGSVTYRYVHDANGVGRIERSEGEGSAIAITAPEVSIDEMLFYVVGTNRRDNTQPKVVIVVSGSAGVQGSPTRTTFHIQATAVQRVLDL